MKMMQTRRCVERGEPERESRNAKQTKYERKCGRKEIHLVTGKCCYALTLGVQMLLGLSWMH